MTVNQVLGTAALLEHKAVRCLDQTGLSQKGGAVVSHLKIFDGPVDGSNKVGIGEADGYIGFDVLTASDVRHLIRARPDRTVAIVSSSHVATGLMVRNPLVEFPADSVLHARIDAVTQAGENVYFDAERLAEFLFGSHMMANFIVVGAAYQAGLIPLRAENIETALELNGTAAAANIQAFRVGRKIVAEPAWADALVTTRGGAVEPTPPAATPAIQALIDATGTTGETRRLLAIRIPDLVSYQNEAYAKRYADVVAMVWKRERAIEPDTALSAAVARYLYKLMAYKDEYEVARLALEPTFDAALTEKFGSGARMSFRLHPPVLRGLGMKKKIALGRWFRGVFRLLYSARGLRGTAFDPFGRDSIRRLERDLIGEYRSLIEVALNSLTSASYDQAVALARTPDMIRGYENVKRKNVERFRHQVRLILDPAVPEPNPARPPMAVLGG